MICSKCGSELKDGHLYCEQCGTEVQIVPDFEPEIENSISETLNTLAEDFGEQAETDAAKQQSDQKQAKKKRNLLFYAGGTVVLLLVLSIYGLNRYQNSSYEYQLQKAVSCADNHDYIQAISYLSKAVQLDASGEEARLLMADYYIANSDIKEAKVVLREVIAENPESEAAYGKLIKIYEQKKDYDAINRLLMASDSALIHEKFNKYMALPPEFSSPEGNYNEIVPLKLSSNTSGLIYYTTDGSTPGKNSIRYTAPFMLETGEYHVKAVFINDYGISSECVEKVYKITVAVPLAPEVPLLSGNYTEPTMIEVSAVPEGNSIYYTLDGSIPTQDSIPYTIPIAMPMGNSCFKFIVYSEEGVCGEITTRNYSLKVQTQIQPQDAVNLLVQGLKERSVILELDGSVNGKPGKNSYIASTLINIGGNYIYLVVEYYTDTLGTITRTGNLYGADANTGVLFKVTTDNKGNYIANPI